VSTSGEQRASARTGVDAPAGRRRSARAGARKGRGAASNRSGRYEAWTREDVDDGWSGDGGGTDDEGPVAKLRTTLTPDASRKVISWNQSPDVPFDRSINPYRGCEHGCVYCYARPTHAWLGLSPGLDFESRLYYKPDAAERLREELAARGYRPAAIALGANTDAYQPCERRLRITRGVLEVLSECAHPVTVVTKSALVERDLDLLAPMAARRLASVAVSVTTLDPALARRLEPRAAAPARRLETIRRLAGAGVPVRVLVAPLIPALTDAELERILERAGEAGARAASYIVLRLPLEIRDLFEEWLAEHYPEKAARVMGRVRDLRGGRAYESGFGTRMRGTGELAALIARRFEVATRRLGYADPEPLDAGRFRPPSRTGQLDLF